MGLWDSFKQVANGGRRAAYYAGGKQFFCDHCGDSSFDEGNAQLNTAGMTFMGLDWANRTATTLVCSSCGKIHWFGIKPDRKY